VAGLLPTARARRRPRGCAARPGLPIPGTTSLAHLHENLQAQSITLSPQEMRDIDDITAPADADLIVTP
jgi:aryl-alcohol dehydrogenase-like predicted oxidoreductase